MKIHVGIAIVAWLITTLSAVILGFRSITPTDKSKKQKFTAIGLGVLSVLMAGAINTGINKRWIGI